MVNFSNGLNGGGSGIVLQPLHLMPEKNIASETNISVQETYEEPGLNSGDTTNFSISSDADKMANLSSIISSGLAGGIATAKIAGNTGIVGESMRAVNVLNEFSNLRAAANSNYNNLSNFDYDDYSVEARRSYGNRNYVGFEGGRTPVMTEFEQQGLKFEGRSQVMKDVAVGTLQGAKYGVLVGGLVSALTNGFNVVTGKTQGKDALGRVAADTVTAGISGASGAMLGGLASFGMGVAGIGGVPGMVIATGIGVAGAAGAQLIMQKSGLYDSLKNKVKTLLGESN